MAVPSVHLVEGDGPRQLVYRDGPDRAVRYRVVRQVLDTRAKRDELDKLRAQTDEWVLPGDEELIELAKTVHPFYMQRPEMLARIAELESELEV